MVAVVTNPTARSTGTAPSRARHAADPALARRRGAWGLVLELITQIEARLALRALNPQLQGVFLDSEG
jgi:hypothetical protein